MMLLLDDRLGNTPRYYLGKEGDRLMLVPDEVRKCAIFVGYRGIEGMKLGGTAFFVGIPRDGIEGTFGYIVTAKHVIDAIRERSVDQKVYLRINLKNKPAEFVGTDLDKWRTHPTNPQIDVAVFPGSPLPDIVDYAIVPITMAATAEVIRKEGIGLGDEVFLTGLFRNHYGQQRNLPIIRIGNIAAMPEEPIETKDLGLIDAYLIEARSIGGLSGSPVFVHVGGARAKPGGFAVEGTHFYWLGLMHGHFDFSHLEIDGLVEDSLSELKVNMGIAIVVPVSKILEVLNQEELMEDRRKENERARLEKAGTPDIGDSGKTFTQTDFEDTLKKISRRVTPSEHDSSSSETSGPHPCGD